MKQVLQLIVAIALASPASAQALNEPFNTSSTGAFPPAGWTETNTGTPEIWVDTSAAALFAVPAGFPTADAAGHAYTGFGAFADSNLMSPAMNLSSSGAPELTYDGGLGYSSYMSHTSIYFGLSDIEVSTDGGVTFASVWSEAAVVDYWTPAITLDLTGSAANQASVVINFRYQGEFAHEWVVDNVIVDGLGPSGPTVSVTCGAGLVDIQVNGCTPGGMVAIARGLAAPYTHQGPICNSLIMGVGVTHRRMVTADAGGTAVWNQPLNPVWCGSGIYIQAVDVATCTTTGSLAL